MTVLRFRFENHGSFRDEAELSFVHPRLKTNRPMDGDWGSYSFSVAAIYGANASGKTSVLDALSYLRTLIAKSSTAWSDRKRIPRLPFALDSESGERASTFALDIVIDGTRYEYGVSVLATAVVGEWLFDYPSSRRRVLFERGADRDSITFGRAVPGGAALGRSVGKRELLLSRGALLDNEVLGPVWQRIVDGISVTKFGDNNRQSRLNSVMADVIDEELSLEDLRLLLKVADVGIGGARVEEGEGDPEVERLLRMLLAENKKAPEPEGEDDSLRERVRIASRKIHFEHIGEGDQLYQLSMARQSAGTLTWLSLAGPAVKALRAGSLYAVDELDASLHPQLARVLIAMFRDERINRHHAQLLFTTHDTFFLSPASGLDLQPGEVWFVEKNRVGRSELFSLDEFTVRSDDNFARRYLQGRYGATPTVAPSFMAALVGGVESAKQETEDW